MGRSASIFALSTLLLLSAASSWADSPLVVYDSASRGSGFKAIAAGTLSTTGVLTVHEVIATTVTGNTGASDHGMLTGLGDDDHTQYVLDSEKANLVGTTNRITVTGGTNAVLAATTLTLPQDIHVGATPTFSTLLLTGNALTMDDGVDPEAALVNSGSGLLLTYGGDSIQNWSDAQTNIYVPTILSDSLTVDSPTFVVDPTNNRVGVGTTSPAVDLDVARLSSGAEISARVANLVDAAGTKASLRLETGGGWIGKVMMQNGAGGDGRMDLSVPSSGAISFTGGSLYAKFDPTPTDPSYLTSKKFTIGASDGLSAFNVEGGATIGGASYVGSTDFDAASGELFLERNLLMGTATTSGSALINMSVNRTDTTPMIAMSNVGSGDAGILITNASNVWQWGSRNALTGDPFVIGGGTSPTVTDLIFITKAGEIGVRVAVPDAMLDVVAANTYANPVLELDQKDDDQAFISFLGNEDVTAPASDPVTSAYLPSAFGDFDIAVRVEVNGVAYWLPLYQ